MVAPFLNVVNNYQCQCDQYSLCIGPSVLDVFRTLVKHLRNSIEESSDVQEQVRIR